MYMNNLLIRTLERLQIKYNHYESFLCQKIFAKIYKFIDKNDLHMERFQKKIG